MKRKTWFSIVLLAILMIAGCSSSPMTKNEPKSNEIANDFGGIRDSGAPTEQTKPSLSNDDFKLTKENKVIHTIGLELETKDYSNTLSKIEALTHSLNGYVQNSTIPRNREDEKYSDLVAYYTLMIPTENIDKFIISAGEVSNIVNESRNAMNVTESYFDTEARISSLKTKETRLLELLKQSGTLADLLQIETELSNTRYEIEMHEATLRNYDNRIAYTQFNVTVREVYTYTPAKRDGVWDRIVDDFASNWQRLVWSAENIFIFSVSTLPFMLLQLLIIVIPICILILLYQKLSGIRLFGKHKTIKDNIKQENNVKDNPIE